MVNQIQVVLRVVEILTFASWLYFTNFADLNTGKTDVVKPAWRRRPDTKQDKSHCRAIPMQYHRKYNQEQHYNEWSLEMVGIRIDTVRNARA